MTARVARGAGWLDAVNPTWWQQIDLGTFDFGNPCLCVLGQCYDDYLQIAGHIRSAEGFRAVQDLGFDFDVDIDERPFLEQEWVRTILERRGEA